MSAGGLLIPRFDSLGADMRAETKNEKEKMMNAYILEMPAGTRITTIYAESVEAARARARDVLNRPGRYPVFTAWRDGGERVRDETTNMVYMN